MAEHTRKSMIDFSSYLSERTDRFAGREWVCKAINEWLADCDGSRFFLLEGEPGSGKTAIAAHLAQIAQGSASPPSDLSHLTPGFLAAVHFCRSQQPRWINPSTFIESVAGQLAARYPAYAAALVKRSGDRQIHIEVQQQIQQVQDNIAVNINRLDVSRENPQAAFEYVIREPLESLFDVEPEQQVLILIDALDEAFSFSGNVNIVSLLTQADDLPHQVRFLITTRPGVEVLPRIRGSGPEKLVLTSGSGLVNSWDDVQQYILETIANRPILESRFSPELSREAFVHTVLAKSVGNFLYARYLLTMLIDSQEQIDHETLNTLPVGLDEIYREFLARVLRREWGSWDQRYAPLLGALAVAQEALTNAQLSSLTGKGQSEIRTILKEIRQFLDVDEALPASQRTYAMYHRSFIEFLLDPDRSEDYYCDATEQHQLLARWCERGDPALIWKDILSNPAEQGRREYARHYYINHLYYAQQWQQLFAVLDAGAYGRAKLRNDSSGVSYMQDLYIGQLAAVREKGALEDGIELLPHLWRYTLLRCSLLSIANSYPPTAFKFLVVLGREQKALALTNLIATSDERAKALLAIAQQMSMQPGQEQERILQVLLRAYDVAKAIAYPGRRAEVLREVAEAFTNMQQWKQAREVIVEITEHSQRARALGEMGRVLAEAGDGERAEAVWAEAEEAIGAIEWMPEKIEALSAVGLAFARGGQERRAEAIWAEAERLTETIEESDAKSVALSKLGRAFAQSGRWEKGRALIHAIEGSEARLVALSELGILLARAGRWEETESLIQTLTVEEGQKNVGPLLIMRKWKDERTGAVAYTREWAGGRVAVLSALGASLAQAGRGREVETVWTEAELVIRGIQGMRTVASTRKTSLETSSIGNIKGGERAEALSVLGVALALAGEKQRAETIWTEMEQMILRGEGGWQNPASMWSEDSGTVSAGNEAWNGGMAEALHEIAVALIRAGEWERAEAVIRWIDKDDSHRAKEALREMAVALIRAGEWERAEAVIRWIDKDGLEGKMLRELEDALVATEQWERLMAVRARTEEIMLVRMRERERSSGMQLRTDVDQLLHIVEAEGDDGKQGWERSLIAISRLRIDPAASLPEHSEQSNRSRGREKLKGTLRGEVWTYPREYTNTRGWVRILAGQWDAATQVTTQNHEKHLETAQIFFPFGSGSHSLPKDAKKDPEIEASFTYRVLPDTISLWSSGASRSDDEEEEYTDDEEEQGPYGEIGAAGAQEEWEQARALKEQVVVLARARKWEQAQEIIQTIRKNALKQKAQQDLGKELVQAQEWARAKAVIRDIERQEERVRALADFGLALTKVHEQEQAKTIWAEAEEIIRTIVWSDARTKALYGLGMAYTEAQEWQRAEMTIRSIEWNEERRKALHELGVSLARARQWEQAERVIHSIEEGEEKSPWRDDAFHRLGIALAEADKWERAEAVIRSIEWDEERAKALRELGLILARAQQWERAGRVACSIEESHRRAKPLGKRSMLLSRRHEWKEVEDLVRLQKWEQAEGLIRSIKNNWIQVQALCELAMRLAEAHKWERAETLICSIGEDNSWETEQVAWELATMLAGEEKWERAERVIRSMVAWDKEQEALCELAIRLARAQQWERAEAIIESIEGDVEKDKALSELGVSLARAQQWERAEAVISEIEEEIEEKDRALSELIESLTEAQQWEQAWRVFQRIDYSDKEKAWLLSTTAQRHAEDGEYDSLLSIVQDSWIQANTRKEAIQGLLLATGFIPLKGEIGTAFYEAIIWVDTFLKG